MYTPEMFGEAPNARVKVEQRGECDKLPIGHNFLQRAVISHKITDQ